MKIVFATGNANKFNEVRDILSDLPVEIHSLKEFPDLPETVEDGATLVENALKKAREACEFTKMTAIADDSGLFVDALDGAPGVFSARYAGENCTYSDNNKKLLEAMNGLKPAKRSAHFSCVAAIVMPDGEEHTCSGVLNGRIAEEMHGDGGFGYDPLFKLPDGRTMAEISSEEKNAISHRAKAFTVLKKLIEQILNRDE